MWIPNLIAIALEEKLSAALLHYTHLVKGLPQHTIGRHNLWVVNVWALQRNWNIAWIHQAFFFEPPLTVNVNAILYILIFSVFDCIKYTMTFGVICKTLETKRSCNKTADWLKNHPRGKWICLMFNPCSKLKCVIWAALRFWFHFKKYNYYFQNIPL